MEIIILFFVIAFVVGILGNFMLALEWIFGRIYDGLVGLINLFRTIPHERTREWSKKTFINLAPQVEKAVKEAMGTISLPPIFYRGPFIVPRYRGYRFRDDAFKDKELLEEEKLENYWHKEGGYSVISPPKFRDFDGFSWDVLLKLPPEIRVRRESRWNIERGHSYTYLARVKEDNIYECLATIRLYFGGEKDISHHSWFQCVFGRIPVTLTIFSTEESNSKIIKKALEKTLSAKVGITS